MVTKRIGHDVEADFMLLLCPVMNKLIDINKKYQVIRLLLNGIFLYVFIQMAYQNYLNEYGRNAISNKALIAHQIAITVLFYGIVYFILFFYSYTYLFRKRLTAFYVYTVGSILVGGLLLGVYQYCLYQKFSPVNQFILVPINLVIDLKEVPFAAVVLEIYQKLFLLYVMLALSFFTRNYFIERRTKELLQQKQMESELAQLKSQINPHFLFNVLNSIYSLAIKQSDKTPDIVMRLSDLLRYMLYESKTEAILLQKEIQLVIDYIEIEKIRILPNQTIHMQTSGEFERNKIAPLLFLPFVENAVKHGLDSIADEGYIHIDISCHNNTCNFICENAFKNGSTKGQEGVGGIGIDNATKRLALLYPDCHQLKVSKENNIFTVRLELILEAI